MARIEAALQLCQGYANCMVADPKHFDLNDEDKVEVLIDAPAESDLPAVLVAVRSCPARALKIVEEA